MARTRYAFDNPSQVHFLTDTVVEWLPVFSRPEAVRIILDSWAHQQAQHGLRLYGYVIMENHLHAIAQADELPTVWARFKSFTALQIVAQLENSGSEQQLRRMAFAHKAMRSDRQYQFWQEGSHPQVISSSDMLRQKLEYMHQNPVKRGYIDFPEHWRYSSARDYAGEKGLIDVFMDWR